jgi:capsid protein
MLHLAYYDTFEQVRGVSPLASAIASYHDVLEMSEYARLKAKVSQFFSMTIARDAPEYRGLGESDCDSDYGSQLRDFGKAPLILDLDPGDKAEFLESKTPSTEFQAFIQLSLQIALKSLDIPWSFLDESHTNYSGSRIATLQYIKSCESKRRDVELLLDQITYWIISNWVAQGVVELPGGMTMKDVKWKWIPAGTPWFNPAEEGQADIDLINAGLKTRTEVRLEKFGDNWKDVADRLKDEEEYINELNLKLTTGGSNSIDSGAEARATIVEESQETEDNTEEEEDNAKNSA